MEHSLHICTFCERAFARKESLFDHLRVHIMEKSHPCPLCEKTFSRKNKLTNHMFVHFPEKKFKCDTCPKSYKQLDTLSKHKLTHNSEKPFKCSSCDKRFHSSRTLNSHVAHIHAPYNSRRFWCDLCDKRFVRNGEYLQHILSHTLEKPFKCEICGKSYNQQGNLNVHQLIHLPRQFGCTTCSKLFTTKKDLKVHTLRMHMETGKPHICNICEKSFLFPKDLRVHQRIHTEERPFECQICFVRLKSKDILTRHLKTVHSPENNTRKRSSSTIINCKGNYSCVFCPCRYSREVNCLYHMMSHTGEKPFACPLCDNCFLRKRSLEQHIGSKHTLERPYQCGPECGKTFATAEGLRKHKLKQSCTSLATGAKTHA